MSQKCARVVKSDQIEMNGTAYIEAGIGTVGRSPLRPSETPAGGQVVQQARVIESNENYAILELVCSCGSKSRVQCNYGIA